MSKVVHFVILSFLILLNIQISQGQAFDTTNSLVYLRVLNNDNQEIVYRSESIEHRYAISTDDCYYLPTDNNHQLHNQYLVIAREFEFVQVIDFVLDQIILDVAWQDGWYIAENNLSRGCAFRWYANPFEIFLGIRSNAQDIFQYRLLRLNGQDAGTVMPQSGYAGGYCGLSDLTCDVFNERILTLFPSYDANEIGLVMSRNSRFFVISACMENNEFEHNQICPQSEIETVIVDIDTLEIIASLDDAVPMYYQYYASGTTDVLTNDSRYSFSNSGRYLAYLNNNDAIVVYDLILQDILHVSSEILTDNQEFPLFWTRLNWAPDDMQMVISITDDDIEPPTLRYLVIYEMLSNSIQISSNLVPNGVFQTGDNLVWISGGDAVAWIGTLDDQGILFVYQIEEDIVISLDENVRWIAGF